MVRNSPYQIVLREFTVYYTHSPPETPRRLSRDSAETPQRLYRDSTEVLQRLYRDSTRALWRLCRDSTYLQRLHRDSTETPQRLCRDSRDSTETPEILQRLWRLSQNLAMVGIISFLFFSSHQKGDGLRLSACPPICPCGRLHSLC